MQMTQLFLRRGLLLIAAVVSVFGLSILPVSGAGSITVTVSVSADPAGNQLTYRWRSSDGRIIDQDARSTQWTLPAGPGLHFAYVLVSNGKGGYTQRRVEVNTDTIGNPIIPTAPQTLQAPAAPAPPSNAHAIRAWVELGGGKLLNDLVPGVLVRWQDTVSGALYPPGGPVTTNAGGEYVIPDVPASTYACLFGISMTPGRFCVDLATRNTAALNDPNAPVLLSTASNAATDYIDSDGFGSTPTANGNLVLSDHQPCGQLDEFFGVHSLPTATVSDASGHSLLGPVSLNKFGGVSFDILGTNLTVTLTCEGAAPVVINGVNITASQTSYTDLGARVIPNVVVPVISGMTATYNGDSSVGTFPPLPPALPSDKQPRPDAYLSYK